MLTDPHLAVIREWLVRALDSKGTPIEAEDADEIVKDVETLVAEVDRLRDFCQEFVWGEENPQEYDTLHGKYNKLKEENSNLTATLALFYHIRGCEWCSGPDDGCEEGQGLEWEAFQVCDPYELARTIGVKSR